MAVIKFIASLPRALTGLSPDATQGDMFRWFNKLMIKDPITTILFTYLLASFNKFQFPIVAVIFYEMYKNVFEFGKNLQKAYPESTFSLHSEDEIAGENRREMEENLSEDYPLTVQFLREGGCSTQTVFDLLIKDGMFHGYATILLAILQHSTRKQARILLCLLPFAKKLFSPFSHVNPDPPKTVTNISDSLPSQEDENIVSKSDKQESDNVESNYPLVFDLDPCVRVSQESVSYISLDEKNAVINFAIDLCKKKASNIIHVRDYLSVPHSPIVSSFFKNYEIMNRGNVFFRLPLYPLNETTSSSVSPSLSSSPVPPSLSSSSVPDRERATAAQYTDFVTTLMNMFVSPSNNNNPAIDTESLIRLGKFFGTQCGKKQE
jgi:hypothetical protein